MADQPEQPKNEKEENKKEEKALAPKKGWFERQVDKSTKFAIRSIFKTVYRADIEGMENIKNLKGKPALIVANHVSSLDGILLSSILPENTVFAYKKESYEESQKHMWRRFLMKRVNVFPVDASSPWAIKSLTELA